VIVDGSAFHDAIPGDPVHERGVSLVGAGGTSKPRKAPPGHCPPRTPNSSKRALLKAVLNVSFGGDDQPVAFGDRPEVQAARAETDPQALITAFARIGRDFMQRSTAGHRPSLRNFVIVGSSGTSMVERGRPEWVHRLPESRAGAEAILAATRRS